MFMHTPLAFDLGASSLKIVELGQTPSNLKKMILEVMPSSMIKDGIITDYASLVAFIKSVITKEKISTFNRRVNLSLGGTSVIINRLNFSVAADQVFEEQVYIEAEQYFQGNLDDIYLDFVKLDVVSAEKNDVAVMLVGVKREIIDEYIKLIHEVGLKPGVIECSVFSIANMIEFNYGRLEGVFLIVDIGADSSRVSLLINGEFVFTREISIGGNEYNRRIMESLDVDYANAENLKISAAYQATDSYEGLMNAINDVNSIFVDELKLSVDYAFESNELSTDQVIQGAFLTGGSSRVLGLDAAIAANLELPVQFANPFQKVNYNSKKISTEKISSQSNLFSVALGLALRKIEDQN